MIRRDVLVVFVSAVSATIMSLSVKGCNDSDNQASMEKLKKQAAMIADATAKGCSVVNMCGSMQVICGDMKLKCHE